jgi:ankyrin repeat protein
MPVNMHFVNEGRTPLIAAVQECGIPALKAILSHNPDKNAYNAFGTYTPIFAAIKLGSIEKVTLLIDSGASIFRRCGISNGNAGLFINRQNLVLSFALNAAISRYNETKTENALKIVDFILKRGGALCTDLTTCPLAVCDLLTETTLALGANLPQALVSKPITTVAMFIQKIDKRDYPQQLSTVQLAILSMNPQLDELTKLYLHLKISEPVILLLALHPEYAPIMDALDKQEYSLALRRACVCENHPDGLKIASVIMEHAKGLSLKIDECTSKGKSAYDLATDAGNAALCASIRNYYPSVRIRSANSM